MRARCGRLAEGLATVLQCGDQLDDVVRWSPRREPKLKRADAQKHIAQCLIRSLLVDHVDWQYLHASIRRFRPKCLAPTAQVILQRARRHTEAFCDARLRPFAAIYRRQHLVPKILSALTCHIRIGPVSL